MGYNDFKRDSDHRDPLRTRDMRRWGEDPPPFNEFDRRDDVGDQSQDRFRSNRGEDTRMTQRGYDERYRDERSGQRSSGGWEQGDGGSERSSAGYQRSPNDRSSTHFSGYPDSQGGRTRRYEPTEFGMRNQGYGSDYSTYRGEPRYDRFEDRDYRTSGADYSGYRESHPDYGRGIQSAVGMGRALEPAYDTPDRGGDRGRARTETKKRNGPKGYKRSDDRVRDEIIDVLLRDSPSPLDDLEITVKDGVATLTGAVESRHCRHRIEDLVDGVWGVREVTNNLRIESESASSGSRRSASSSTSDSSVSNGGLDHSPAGTESSSSQSSGKAATGSKAW